MMLNLGIVDRGKEKFEEKWNKGCDVIKIRLYLGNFEICEEKKIKGMICKCNLRQEQGFFLSGQLMLVVLDI